MSTYPMLLSYPGPTWKIRGAQNFRSEQRPKTNPRAAMTEWLDFADALTRQGVTIAVMPPPEVDPPLTGIIYTANHGALFVTKSAKKFVVANMFAPHRQPEADYVETFIGQELRIPTERSAPTWEGQAEIATLSPGTLLLTWGVRSARESCEAVEACVKSVANTLTVKIRDPYFHGDTCISPLTLSSGKRVLLLFRGAFVDRSVAEISRFVGRDVEVVRVSEADALAYALNGLCVKGTIFMPEGVSLGLLEDLRSRGFAVESLDFAELFGKGGGGPRCLVNELRGLIDSDIPKPVRYLEQRSQLFRLRDSYPTE